jgi:hypothetical protein
MQVDSIISNTISEEIRLKGHQTIRLVADGFSLLISDPSYKPVLLKRYSFDPALPGTQFMTECGNILEEESLLDFEGETVLMVDSLCTSLVPKQLFNEGMKGELLQKTCAHKESDQILHRPIRNGNFYLIFAVSQEVIDLQQRFHGNVKIIHVSECMVSLADQVQASDHQRGAVLIDVQPYTLDLLVIQGDQIQLLNHYSLNETLEFVYHTLNTLKQLNINREIIPIYLSGIIHEEHELFGTLGKYIRKIKTTPYYMEELSKVEILRSMILSEGSKCA